MSTNDNNGTRRLSHVRPRKLKPRQTAKEINREYRREAIEISVRQVLGSILAQSPDLPKKQLAMVAIELAKLRGDTNPFAHLEDAAALWTAAGEAISYEKDTKPRLIKEAQQKKWEDSLKRHSDEDHPFKPGEIINPDDFVPFALLVSDGTDLEGVVPPCKTTSGKRPPVPLYKSAAGLMGLLRKMVRNLAMRELPKGEPEPSSDDIEAGAKSYLEHYRNGKFRVWQYEQVLWHYTANEGARTKAAREALEAKRNAKADVPLIGGIQLREKPVKSNHPKKSTRKTKRQDR